MSRLSEILDDLDDRTLAREVGLRHDEARNSVHVSANTVSHVTEMRQAIISYARTHVTYLRGGDYQDHMINGYAVRALEEVYGEDWWARVSRNALDGTEGGLAGIFDAIANGMKAEDIRLHVDYVLDDLDFLPWEEKVEMIRELFDLNREHLSPKVRVDEPEIYAKECRKVIASYVAWRNRTFSTAAWNPFPDKR